MKKLISLLSILLLFISCSKDENSDVQPISNTTIYGVGSLDATANSRAIACYSENDKIINLSSGTFDAVAESIVVSDNGDKHIVGYEKKSNGNIIAKYWKNGVATNFPATILGEDSVANDIAISGSDVYISGNEDSDNGNSIAIYWKNNNKEYLSSSTNDTQTTAIAIANNKVYVTGYEKNGTIKKPLLWIDGVAINITTGTNDAYVSDIVIVGTKIYLSGYENISGNQFAVYWLKDTAVSNSNFVGRVLPTTIIYGGAQSITSIGTDVYISGYEASDTKYWKVNAMGDKIATTLTNSGSDSDAGSIFAFQNDIYTLTNEDSIGNKYWKNGSQITTFSNNKNYRIYGLFVNYK